MWMDRVYCISIEITRTCKYTHTHTSQTNKQRLVWGVETSTLYLNAIICTLRNLYPNDKMMEKDKNTVFLIFEIQMCRRINCGSRANENNNKHTNCKETPYIEYLVNFLFLCFAQTTLFIIYYGSACVRSHTDTILLLLFLFIHSFSFLYLLVPHRKATVWKIPQTQTHTGTFDVRDI